MTVAHFVHGQVESGHCHQRGLSSQYGTPARFSVYLLGCKVALVIAMASGTEQPSLSSLLLYHIHPSRK